MLSIKKLPKLCVIRICESIRSLINFDYINSNSNSMVEERSTSNVNLTSMSMNMQFARQVEVGDPSVEPVYVSFNNHMWA